MIKALILIAMVAAQGPALSEDEEARAQDIMREVRCMVCSGESILDSGAPMAGDMRTFVRERVAEGSTDDQVRDDLVERFGHEVLLRPPFSGGTLVLWLGPLAILLGGGALLVAAMKRRGAESAKG